MGAGIQVLESDAVLCKTAENVNLLSQGRGEEKNGAKGGTVQSGEITPAERRAMIGMVRDGLSVSLIANTEIVEIRFRGGIDGGRCFVEQDDGSVFE